MGINKERLIALIGEVEKSVTILKEFAGKPKDEILADLKSLGSIKYYFIIAIEACIDICSHITAKEKWGISDSYANCFFCLKENHVISEAFAIKMVSMAKFRNLLVHFYLKIDDEKVYEFLQSELENFQIYIDIISKKYL